MKQNIFQQFLLYKYRYALGVMLYVAALVGLLTIELTSVPGGLSSGEIESTIQSAELSPTLETRIIDLPYHLLQRTSVALLGLNAFAIKLPSVIIAILAGLSMLLLLSRWFRPNVALISALFAVTSSIFLVNGRLGTPVVMVIFWSSLLLLVATLITQQVRGQFAWKALLGLIVGLSLYTPLTIFILLSALIAGFLHPHTRYLLMRFGKAEFALASFLALLAATPLIVGLWHDPTIARQLVGLPEQLPNAREYAGHVWQLALKLGGFFSPLITDTIQPAFNITILILIILGILRSIVDLHATRTYTLLIWAAVILPVVALQPKYIAVLYLPAILFLAIGIQTLIREWYSLFPRNPYARLAGLLPLLVLIIGVGYLNYTTYFMGFRYSNAASSFFDNSLTSLNAALGDTRFAKKPAVVVVPNSELAFYSIAEEEGKNLSVETSNSVSVRPGTVYFVDTQTVLPADVTTALGSPKDFIVSSKRDSSLQWRVYFK